MCELIPPSITRRDTVILPFSPNIPLKPSRYSHPLYHQQEVYLLSETLLLLCAYSFPTCHQLFLDNNPHFLKQSESASDLFAD
jgi:hypothetical protein